MVFDIIWYSEIGSTNDEAKRLAATGMTHGSVIAAKQQTAGKGRLGRNWASSEGGLFFSVILHPPDYITRNPGRLTACAGLAAALTLHKITGLFIKLKWPNDVYYNEKKLCGILAETSWGTEVCTVLGVGINVRQKQDSFPPELTQRASSILIETGRLFDINSILNAYLHEFSILYQLLEDKRHETVITEYKKLCLNIGRTVKLTRVNWAGAGDDGVIGRAVDVDADGGLVVETASGTVTVSTGEVG